MATGVSKLSLFFHVEIADKYIGTPTTHNIRSSLDAHGNLLGLERLPREEGDSYWKRLSTVLPLRASSTSEGLVHGITRELGLEEKTGIIITPVRSGGSTLAPAPHVTITATEVILYSNHITGEIDRTIDIFDHGDGYLLGDLIALVQQSEYFVAELGPHSTGQEKSNGLIPIESIQTKQKEWIPATTYFFLGHDDIVPGTVSFTETDIFGSEVSPAIANGTEGGVTLAFSVISPVAAEGEYHIDYEKGAVTVYSSSTGRGSCRYQYRNFPLRIRWSPVVVYSLRDDNYREKIFETEVMPDNQNYDGLVTDEGQKIYTQIFDKSPCLWGE